MNRIICLVAGCILTLHCGLLSANPDWTHHPGIILGFTNSGGENDPTFGLEYEYKFTPDFGIGAIWERTPGAHSGDGINVLVGSFFYHLTEEWRLGAGVGEERIGGKKVKHKELMRLSVTYEYMTPDYILAPEIAVDYVHGGDTATVVGVALILPF